MRRIEQICNDFLRYFALILLITTQISCFKTENKNFALLNKVEQKVWDIVKYGSGLGRLIHETYEYRNDSLFPEFCKVLNDSILVEKDNFYMHSMTCTYMLDSANTYFSDWNFQKIEYQELPHVSGRILYEICVYNQDTIFIENELNYPENIQKLGYDNIFDPEDKDPNYKKRKKDIEYFGEVMAPNVACVLSTDVYKKNGLSISEWSTFFSCLHEIIELFDKKRDEIALEKWGKKYEILADDKKAAISEYAGHNIILHFDMKCYTIEDLMPPPLEYEDSVLLELE